METNKWLLVPEELKESLHTIWARYGNLLGIAIFFILFVLLVFALIAAHIIPLDLGNLYWFWLIVIVGGGILFLLVEVAFKSNEIESG